MIDCSDTFLPKTRTSDGDIAAKFEAVSLSVNVENIINAMPCLVAVLDENRQIIFCNESLLSLVNVDKVDAVLGKRPGELLGCVNTAQCDADCGTSLYCEFCGAAQAIKYRLGNNGKVVKECRLLSESLGALELSVTTSPFEVEDKVYTLLSIIDISDSKRRASLERTFFHDICNSAGCVKMALDVIEDCNVIEEIKKLSTVASSAVLSLMDEISCQKLLLSAEGGELSTEFNEHRVEEIFNDLQDIWSPYAMGFDVEIAFASEIDYINTDIVLIKRVIGNLIKNGIESSKIGESITVSCFKSSEGRVTIAVNNPAPISDAVLKQIFQRSFTTKGVGRGLGTYSVKLFTEEYLRGKVSVMTNDTDGTTVFLIF